MLRKVATTGVDLETVYDQTLRRIKEQKRDRSRLGMEVLMWVSHAERPLRIDELSHALAVEMGATELDPENVPPQDTVLGSCLGLAVVDKETSTVRLIHYTLQEYLSRPGVLPNAHRTLGETCLTYLNYAEVKGLSADGTLSLGSMPFLEYSSLHWGGHAKIELSDYEKSLVLELLNRYDNHISSVLLFKRIRPHWPRPLSHRPFPGLHCASYFGVAEVMTALMQMEGCDINQGDCIGFTPLMWAAWQGHQEAVVLLLARGDIDPDRHDNHDQTPLCGASFNGHEGVVGLLLARGDVDPNKPNNSGETPLLFASSNGHEEVVRLLLARDDVNPNKPNNSGETPLLCASSNGHEGVVRLLLALGDADPDRPDILDQTPLWRASFHGHEGVVKLLLAQDDVNPDKSDYAGDTPLLWACSSRHEEVVRLLLARDDVNPNKENNRGDTPLLRTSSCGNERVVRLLLARDDIDPNKPGKGGNTPLLCLSRNGWKGAVRLLLARDDVNPNKPNNHGETPLDIATRRRHWPIVALLQPRITPVCHGLSTEPQTQVYLNPPLCPHLHTSLPRLPDNTYSTPAIRNYRSLSL